MWAGGGEEVIADVGDGRGAREGVVPCGGDGGDGGERGRGQGDEGVSVEFYGCGSAGPGPAV